MLARRILAPRNLAAPQVRPARPESLVPREPLELPGLASPDRRERREAPEQPVRRVRAVLRASREQVSPARPEPRVPSARGAAPRARRAALGRPGLRDLLEPRG